MDILGTIGNFLGGVLEEIVQIWHALMDDLLSTGWGIAASLCFVAVLITFGISTWRSLGEYAKAWDAGWSQARLDEDNKNAEYRGDGYTIDWRQARLQQAVVKRFSIPFGLMVLASMIYLLWFEFSWVGYWHVAVVWFAFAIPLRFWWIRTLRRASESLRKHGLLVNGDHMIRGTSWDAFKFYIAWGASKKDARVQRRFFRYRLRRLNGFLRLVRLDLVSARLIKPLLYWLFYVSVWPVAMVVSVFVLTHNIMAKDRHFSLRPEWASKYVSPPSGGGLYTAFTKPETLAA